MALVHPESDPVTPPPTNGYRLERLEKDLTELRVSLQNYQSNTDGKLDRIIASLSDNRELMPERYIPRREFSERLSNFNEDTVNLRRDLEKRIEEQAEEIVERRREIVGRIEERINRVEERTTVIEGSITWLNRLILGTIATALISGAVGVLFLVARAGLKLS